MENRNSTTEAVCQKCSTCHDQGEVFIGPGKVESHMLEEPEPIYSTCPDCTQPSPVQELDFSKPLETVNGEPVKWIGADVIEYKSALVCVAKNTGIIYSSPYIGLKIRNVITEQAEAERPEQPKRYTADVFYHNHFSTMQMEVVRASDFEAFASKYECIVGALRFERQQMDRAFTACINERDAALAEVERIKAISDNYYVICVDRQQQLDTALVRVAELEARLMELEKQEPVAWLYRGTDMGDQLSFLCLNHYWRPKYSIKEHDYIKGVPLYAAPPAQAQHSVPEGWRLVPLEPTGEMIAAANANPNRHKEGVGHEYRAMLAAAPGKEGV